MSNALLGAASGIGFAGGKWYVVVSLSGGVTSVGISATAARLLAKQIIESANAIEKAERESETSTSEESHE